MPHKTYAQLLTEVRAGIDKKMRREAALAVLPNLVRVAVAEMFNVPHEYCQWGLLGLDDNFEEGQQRETANGIEFAIMVEFVDPGSQQPIAHYGVVLHAKFTGTDYLISVGGKEVETRAAPHLKPEDFSDVANLIGEKLAEQVQAAAR